MKRHIAACALLLSTPVLTLSQVASHKPTVFRQAPAPPNANLAVATPGKPVVRVNGTLLTDQDLLREEYAIFPYARQHNGGIPKDLAPQIREGALKMLVFEELVYQEAQRRNIIVPAARMQRAEADFRKQFTNPEAYTAFLHSEFQGSPQLLDVKIRRSLLIEAMLKTEVDSKSAVTAADVRAFYDKNPARFAQPESYTFQSISVLPPDHATPDQLKQGHARAEDALKKARATKTSVQFGLLAEKTSDDDYRVVMGQHKPVPVTELPPVVLKTLAAMHPGDVSDILQLDQAYTILRLQVHTPAGRRKFEEVRAALFKELHETKTNQLRSALDQKLRQTAKIEVM